jgi:hypothetical protein
METIKFYEQKVVLLVQMITKDKLIALNFQNIRLVLVHIFYFTFSPS